MTSVSWGVLEPGQNQTITFYLRNEGNSPTTLSFDTSNWTPQGASTFFDLSWDYDGDPIEPDSIQRIRLTLSVDSNIQGIENFSFDLTIVGS